MTTVVAKGNTFLSVMARARQLNVPPSQLLKSRPLDAAPSKDEFDSMIEDTKVLEVVEACWQLWYLARTARAVWKSDCVEEAMALREMEKRLVRFKKDAKTAEQMKFVYAWAEDAFPVKKESADALESMLRQEIPGSDYRKLEKIRKLSLGETVHKKVWDAIRDERAKIAWVEIKAAGSDTKKLWKFYSSKKHGGNSYLAVDPIIEHTNDIDKLKQVPIRIGEPQYKVYVLHAGAHPLSWNWEKVWKKIVSLTEDVEILFEAIDQTLPHGNNDFVREVCEKILRVTKFQKPDVMQKVLGIMSDRELLVPGYGIREKHGWGNWRGVYDGLQARLKVTRSSKEARIIYDIARSYQSYDSNLGPYFQVQIVAVIDRLTPEKSQLQKPSQSA